MLASGVFKDQKVELVAGRIYPMTDLPPHTFALERLREALRGLIPLDRWTIREEKPIQVDRLWAPKPDLSVLRGDYMTFAARLPVPADVALIAEVSDTTYHRDRGAKWRKYASGGIPCYLIVRLRGAKTVAEVWTEPTGKGNNARYAEVVRYRADAGESIPIEMDGQPFGQVPVAGLSPS
jgi:hypothetical protein